MTASTFSALVRLQLSASASYSNKKSASGSFGFPEKYGALFERGPGIADSPDVDIARVAGSFVGG